MHRSSQEAQWHCSLSLTVVSRIQCTCVRVCVSRSLALSLCVCLPPVVPRSGPLLSPRRIAHLAVRVCCCRGKGWVVVRLRLVLVCMCALVRENE